MRRLRDDGLSAIIGFIIGGLLFFVVFYYVVETAVKNQGDTTNAAEADYSSAAQGLADVLFSTGDGWYSGTPCVTSGNTKVLASDKFHPDGVGQTDPQGKPAGRFGLGDEACGKSGTDPSTRNNVSYDKLLNLYQSKSNSDPQNGRVDYQEARRSLGLTAQGINFHIRSWPLMPPVGKVIASGGVKDPVYRPLYLGDYDPTATAPVRPGITSSGTAQEDPNYIYLNVTINNNATFSVAAAFQVVFSIPLSKGDLEFTQNSLTVNVAQSVTVGAKIAKTKDWAWRDPADKRAYFSISDQFGALATGSISFGVTTPDAPKNGANNLVVVIYMDRSTYQEPFGGSNKWPVVRYTAYNGKGQTQGSFDATQIDLKVIGSGLIPYVKTYLDPPKNGQSLEDALMTAGSYRVEASVPAIVGGTVVNDDQFEILPAAQVIGTCNVPSGGYLPSSAAQQESKWIDALVETFDPLVMAPEYTSGAIPYGVDGDIYPDVKCSMNKLLPSVLLDAQGKATLSRYNLMIVGSDVDQNGMTSSAAKHTVRDWVLAGGVLLVFGSAAQNVDWLDPLFHSAIETANGGVYTPDSSHPALASPNSLDYAAYQYTTDWKYSSGADAMFTHIVVTQGGGDVLAVSNAGAFSLGRIILTSWKPYALVSNQATQCTSTPTEGCQSLRLLQNLIDLGYGELYLDFGPKVPEGSASGSYLRLGNVYVPQLATTVPLIIQVYAFP